jgi:hypothetical protein
MGMGAQNRGATGAPAPTQMAMQGGSAPQGLMALMQQRGKGAGMPGGQMDPGMMQMMDRLQGNVPQPAQRTDGGAETQYQQFLQQTQMPPGMSAPGGMDPRVDQFGRPSATGQFAFDPQQQQRIAEAGLTPDRLSQMTPDQMARFQPMAPVDIDPRTGRPVGAGGKGAGLPPPRTQEEMQRAMDKMQFASEMRGNIDPRTGAPVGALVSQPAPGKGGGLPTRPSLPSTMVNPARPRPNVPNRTQAERDNMRGQRGGPGGR